MRAAWLAAMGLALAGGAAPAAAVTGASLTMPLSSSDSVGLAFMRQGRSVSASATLGMWSDDGALELGGFQDGPSADLDPSIARAAELVSGKPIRSRGLRAAGIFYRGGSNARGWALSVEGKRQQVSDVGAALSGSSRNASDSRLSVSGKLKF